jgi:predicted KAP-like P-loop ATPase
MAHSHAKRPDDNLPTTEFFGDEALEDPADDALDYKPFAAKLADALLKLKPKSGLVLALFGSWGGGKSTMLNFVAKDLGSRPKAQQPTIIRFNPWWFSGQEDLVSIFFEELIRGLKLDSLANKSLKAALKTVPPLLRILGKMVSKAPKPILAIIGHGATIAPTLGVGIEQLGNELEKLGVNTLTETKAKIEDKLKRFPSKILVIIDDLEIEREGVDRRTGHSAGTAAASPDVSEINRYLPGPKKCV